MSENYYYLVAGLPEISIDDQGKIGDALAIKTAILEDVSPSDRNLVNLIYAKYDHQNLLNILLSKKESLSNDLGSLTYEQLTFEEEGAWTYLELFTEFMQGKMANTDSKEESGVIPEDILMGYFYESLNGIDNAFIKSWFKFEQEVGNLLTVYSCRKLGKDPANFVIGNNEFNQTIIKSNSQDFSIKGEFDYIDKLLKIMEEPDPIEKEKALDILRWEFIDQEVVYSYFNIDQLLAFLLKLQIVDRWTKLNPSTGSEMFSRLISQVNNSYDISDVLSSK